MTNYAQWRTGAVDDGIEMQHTVCEDWYLVPHGQPLSAVLAVADKHECTGPAGVPHEG